jgi:hypothetical protein
MRSLPEPGEGRPHITVVRKIYVVWFQLTIMRINETTVWPEILIS